MPPLKILFLVRHAKSSWEDDTLTDQDRPLNPRGERDAPRMAKALAKRGVKPDLMLSSPALRARATAQVFADALHYPRQRILIDDRLYPGTPVKLLTSLREHGADLGCVMLFAHNPALAELASRLTGTVTAMPTCAVAQLHFEAASWSELRASTLSTVVLERPGKSSSD
jgi:phosphohistidine phosphatase